MATGRQRNNQPTQADASFEPGTSVTIGGTSGTVAAANPRRVEITICNDHATNVLYLRLASTTALINTGIRVPAAGGTYTTRAYTGAITGIATGAGTVVTVTEV